ncbi:MAG: hypothetical protein NXI32_15800 [bacterium]|nr:hypothetical protein [bacterium]
MSDLSQNFQRCLLQLSGGRKRCSLRAAVYAGIGLGVLACFPLERLSAQVVQLPAYRTFSYSGSAWVPDQGTSSLAGSYTYSYQGTGRGWGPYAAGVRSGSRLGGSLSASATIIDLQALDDALLDVRVAQDPNKPPVISATSPAALGNRRFLTTTEPYLLDTGVVPRDPIAYRRALAGHQPLVKSAATLSQIESDVRFYLEEGKKAEQANHIQSARVYYKMAMDAMTPEMIERYQRILEERKQAEEERRKANLPDRIKF